MEKESNEERRQYERIKKSFILSYYDLANPERKFEITQLKNISYGGMCFITSKNYESSTKLGVELKTPYLAGTTHLEGAVLGSNEKMKDAIYETRLQFGPLEAEAKVLLGKLIKLFVEDEE